MEENTHGDTKPAPKEVMTLLGEKWKKATPEEKEVFEKQAKEAHDRYLEELEEYKKSGKADAFKQQVKEREKEKKETKKSKPFTLRQGQEPTLKEMETWIQQYLEKVSILFVIPLYSLFVTEFPE